jgi:lipopolysaccharide biosynthesis glycosyltransferase
MEVKSSVADSTRNLSIDQNVIALVCAADDRYVMGLTVTIKSAIENLCNDYRIALFILDGGIKNHNKQKISASLDSEKCRSLFIPVSNSLVEGIKNEYFLEKNDNKYVSIVSYYRLLISEFIPKEYKKVIYLDCDLVVKGDLSNIWKIDLEDNCILAAQDTWTHFISKGLSNYQDLGICQDAKYFNAGVLVINLEKWRSDQMTKKSLEYLKNNIDHIKYHDQDVLNALLATKWGVLNPRWNVPVLILLNNDFSRKSSPFSADVYDNVVREPYIIHYTTGEKPWTSRHTLFKEYFFHYLDMTSWSGWRLTFPRRVWMRITNKVQEIFQSK